MIVDAHYHLEERMETVGELLEQMDEHGIDQVALIPTMVDPIQLEGFTVKVAEMLPNMLMNVRGVGMLIYRSTVTADGKFSALGKLHNIYATPDNESVAQAMQQHPDRFYGWVFINPAAADPIAELERWAGQPGWIGAKAHPFWHRYPVALLDDAAAWCSERNWPMLIHLGGTREQGDFRYLPDRHPGLKVLYAHAGIPFYQDVWNYGKDKENVFVDLSNPTYVNDRVRLGAVKTMGPRKCLHATDGPYGDSGQGVMAEAIRRLPLSDADRERVLGGNFVELVGG